MEKSFHSTVLARPPGMYDEDDDHRRRREILNPQVPANSSLATQAPPPPGGAGSVSGPRAPFSLRSPTQTEFHNPNTPHHRFSTSPSGSASILNGTNSGSTNSSHHHHHYSSESHPHATQRSASSVLHSPFAQPPPGGPGHPLGVVHPPPAPPTSGISSSLQAPQGYYSQDIREPPPPPPAPREHPATRSFYDPTTDTTTTTKERRPSDAGGGGSNSWHGGATQVSTPKHRDPYNYSTQPPVETSPYYNGGNYKSPVATSYAPSRSPVTTSHSVSVPVVSPSRQGRMASPSFRNAPLAQNPLSSMQRTESPAPKASASSSTPSRAAELMSFSNILSSSEPAPKARLVSPIAVDTPEAATPMEIEESTERSQKVDVVEEVEESTPQPEVKPRLEDLEDASEMTEEVPPHDKPEPVEPEPATPEPPRHLARLEKAPARADKPERVDKPDRAGKVVKAEKPERPEKPEKLERPEKRPRVEKEKKERAAKAPRKSTPANKTRASELRHSESTPKSSRRSSIKHETLSQTRVPSKRQANGQSKQKLISAETEKAVLAKMEDLDDESVDESDFEAEREQHVKSRLKRQKLMHSIEDLSHLYRRNDLSDIMVRKLAIHSNLGKLRYGDEHWEEALKEVRDQELFAEKERKKDMQRKRRREKSMAVTIEQKEAALAKALATKDEQERQKLLREAERANKKAQQTKLILQKGIKGPARNLTPLELNLEGGTMSTFQAENMEPGGKGKGKSKSGNRLKKSKEQKQAEKDSAEAAQAAIDAGEELPTREENHAKIRIKVGKPKVPKDKGKDKIKDKDKEKDKDRDKDKKKDKDKDKDKGEEKEKDKNEDQDEEGVDKDKENKEPDDAVAPPPEKETKKKKEKAEKVVEEPKDSLETRFLSKGFNQIYDQIWRDMARKDVSKVYRLATDSYITKSSNLKKTAILASKEAKRWQLRTNKGTKDLQARAKRVMRDMMTFWKRNEREERDLRKAAERQEIENAKKEEADREAARQKRKLNFLISQTELYSHFIGKKIKTDEVERSTDRPEVAALEKGNQQHKSLVNIKEPTGPIGARVTNFDSLDFDAADDEALQAVAIANAQNAIAEAQKAARDFNKDDEPDEDGELNFQNPTGMGDVEIEQPKLLTATLKEYQLKGLNWLVNLYEQGINGILADEMGLGKTIQSISVMAYLAEKYDVWGPFLVVAPASTLHNWEQEIKRFVPALKIVPYWGTAADRKILRKFWDRKHSTYKRDAQFHVTITSYQMVVSDVAYFQKMKWQYMILDEAQAIKSSQSSRWKCLLSFHCRNRLLLTGTPIQNNMQELWALLHFIMPSLFDSHDEFSEWFSKDIESHAQSNSKLNEDQLKRLHMILKPFMLRRVKKHVQKELGDKIELDVFCNLTYRQRAYYTNLRNQISIMDLIEKATLGDDNDSGTLMNLVMQFRKVCNHPDLFERADTSSPLSLASFAETGSFAREGNNLTVGYTTRNTIEYALPRLLWRDGGRLTKAGKDSTSAGFRGQYLGELMNIWTPQNMRESLGGTDSFAWLRFADTSMGEAEQAGKQDMFARAVTLAQKRDRLAAMKVAYDEDGDEERFTPAHALFQIRQRHGRKALADVAGEGYLRNLMNVSRAVFEDSTLPRLEQAARQRASAPPVDVVCASWGTLYEREGILFNVPMRRALFGPNRDEEKALVLQKVAPEHFPSRALLPAPDNERNRFTSITVPSMRRFVTDSGKLAKLDELLFQLKAGGHRVLLYFQMTRMIDLMEEYLTYRNYKYCRLDGSTKLEDRRDTVHDFQTRPEIFIFLLSTRAGGLGINLTSADTVIFYDSDWNPTIDSQAMDRAHRLGQTRQVTVYRLITRGTIEERIRKRALQKEEVQRVVISGGAGASSGVDFSGRRAPENRNRDIAMWLADDDQAELIERRERELLESGEYDKVAKKRAGGGKRKRAVKGGAAGGGGDGGLDGGGLGNGDGGVSLDEMYHEGEGNFDDNKPSGTATPVVPDPADARPGKKKRTGGKKAKTTKQRLAIADGEIGV